MEQYSNRDVVINNFYNEFIGQVSTVEETNPNKYAWLCGWSDKSNQYKRFEVLTKIGVKKNDTILDIGCGGGELVNYLKTKRLKVDYVGIDINPYYLQIARTRYPNNEFLSSNGWDLTTQDYDWAIASGIFTLETNITYILWYIGFIMERLVRKGFAFNLLNNKAPEGLVSYDPDAVKTAIEDRFPEYKVEIVDGYLPDDFTVYVKK
jgi:SAM-dependent methyltransferase